MTLQIKKEFPWEKIGSFTRVDPWCIAFVYPRKMNGYVVKGGIVQVKKWIESNVTRAVVYYTMFDGGKNRTNISIYTGNPNVYCTLQKSKLFNIVEKRSQGNIRNRKWKLKIFASCLPDAKPSTPGFNSSKSPLQKKNESELVFQKNLRHPPRCWPKELDSFVLNRKITCVACPEAIKSDDGVQGVIGCKLTRFAKHGANCPLGDIK